MQESHIARVAENEAKLKEDGYRLEGSIPSIDNDAALQTLDDQICELYSSYYEFDSHDQACWFNEEQEKADKPLMLELLGKLNARIAELKDGSFVVDDRETPRVEALWPHGRLHLFP